LTSFMVCSILIARSSANRLRILFCWRTSRFTREGPDSLEFLMPEITANS